MTASIEGFVIKRSNGEHEIEVECGHSICGRMLYVQQELGLPPLESECNLPQKVPCVHDICRTAREALGFSNAVTERLCAYLGMARVETDVKKPAKAPEKPKDRTSVLLEELARLLAGMKPGKAPKAIDGPIEEAVDDGGDEDGFVDLTQKVQIGKVIVTPEAKALLEIHGMEVGAEVMRHARGDWGDIDAASALGNEQRLKGGSFQVYSYRKFPNDGVYFGTGRKGTKTLIATKDQWPISWAINQMNEA